MAKVVHVFNINYSDMLFPNFKRVLTCAQPHEKLHFYIARQSKKFTLISKHKKQKQNKTNSVNLVSMLLTL